MPIYEYECPKCGKVFEEWAKSSEAHKDASCPQCGASSPRIMSRTSFVLKGDGWYVSDYGYRKGITEEGGTGAEVPAKARKGITGEGGTGAEVPAKAQNVAPARQPDKTIVKSGKKPADQKAVKSEKKPSKKAAKSTKPSA